MLLLLAFRPLGGDGPRLVSRTDGSTSGAVSAPGPDRYYTVFVGQVCVSKSGSARIRSVEPVDPHGGITVTDFSVVSANVDALGANSGRLRDEPAFRGSDTVSDFCADDKATSDLYLEVFKPRSEDAWANEYSINFEIDGDAGSERIRFPFGICEKDLDLCDHSEGWSSSS